MEKWKQEVIWKCNDLMDCCGGSIWWYELRRLKMKYIYKDISVAEMKRDITWLKDVNKIIDEYGG